MSVIEIARDEPAAELTVPFRWRPRQTLLIVIALLSVFAVTGASRPRAADPGRELWSRPITVDDRISVAGDTVYRQSTADPAELTLYDVVTGAPRWNSGSAPFTRFLTSPADGTVLLVDYGVPVGTTSRGESTITARRITDGAVRWQQPGTALAIDAGVALVADVNAQGRAVRLRQIRIADGAPVWSRSIRPAPQVLVDQDSAWRPSRVVTLDGDDIDLYGWADGALSASGRVAVPADGLLYAARGRLRVDRYIADRITSTWYDLAGFGKLITMGSGALPPVECETLICTADPTGVTATEPGTGRQVWHVADVLRFAPVAPGRMLLVGTDGRTGTLVETATGRVLADRVPGEAAANDTTRDSVLMVRATRSPAERSAVLRLDLRTGAWRPLGLLPLIDDPRRCTATATGLLLCQDVDRMMAVTVPG